VHIKERIQGRGQQETVSNLGVLVVKIMNIKSDIIWAVKPFWACN